MPDNEVFPNPTVKQVIFQVRFPSLFAIEQKVGEFQLQILSSFPKSTLVFRTKVVMVDSDVESADASVAQALASSDPERNTYKQWQFMSEDEKIRIELRTESVTVVSDRHKTYNSGDGERFRDTIAEVVKAFLTAVPHVQKFTRIGLRYIDNCRVPSLDPEVFRAWYATVFPLERFDLRVSDALQLRAQVKRENHLLLFAETFKREDKGGAPSLTLDFDGSAKDVEVARWLTTTDELHQLIWEEYQSCIKEPVYDHMRQERPAE